MDRLSISFYDSTTRETRDKDSPERKAADDDNEGSTAEGSKDERDAVTARRAVRVLIPTHHAFVVSGRSARRR